MELNDLINEAAKLPGITDSQYRKGVAELIARIAPYKSLSSTEQTVRVAEVYRHIHRAMTPFAIHTVSMYHDSGSDPQYIDIRIEIRTTHGEWQTLRTLDTESNERSDGDVEYAEDTNAVFDAPTDPVPQVVLDLFRNYRIAADALINAKLLERNTQPTIQKED